MLEIIVFAAALALDQLVKYWAVTVLAAMPGGAMPILGEWFYFFYAENTGEDVSFLRGRSVVMVIFRLLQLALILYLLIAKRRKLRPVTRVALCLYLAGMLGNQINYFLMDYVPDMFYIPALGPIIFNVADILVLVAMVILFIRLAFFEGRDFMEWLLGKFERKKSGGKEIPDQGGDAEPAVPPRGPDGPQEERHE